MRIAMMTNNYKPNIGGVPVSIEHLAESLRKRGHEVYIFAPTYKNQQEEEFVIRFPSFPFTVGGVPVPDMFTGIFLEKVRELQIELIHVHQPAIVGNVALHLKKKLGIPVVFTYHTRYEQYLYYVKPLEKMERHTGIIEKYLAYFCSRCDMLVAPTPGMKDYLKEKEMATPIGVMPTGITENMFRPKSSRVEEIRSRYQGDADYLFCTVSRLAKEKNLYFQLQELVLLKEKLSSLGKSFRHMMIGDGPMGRELPGLLEQLGLSENVALIGNVPNEEIANYMGASDLFLFTSKSETQGIVILEAMAAGTPVAAIDASGVRDVVVHGKNGMLSHETPGAWSDSILTLLSRKEAYESMKQAARQTALQYSEEAVAQRAEAYYLSLLAQKNSQFPTIYATM